MIILFEKYKNYDDIILELSKINEPYISATEMFNSVEIQEILKFEEIDDYYISKEENYKNNIYYHVDTKNDKPYSGVGNGFYLGKDPISLSRFYDLENEYTISNFKFNAKWFNLMKSSNFKRVQTIFDNYGINIINSDEVSEIVLKMGYDGIRYYDIFATGEEFVLFNMKLFNI